jgi:hypothetical protein
MRTMLNQLHDYNQLKDIGQLLLGKVSNTS